VVFSTEGFHGHVALVEKGSGTDEREKEAISSSIYSFLRILHYNFPYPQAFSYFVSNLEVLPFLAFSLSLIRTSISLENFSFFLKGQNT